MTQLVPDGCWNWINEPIAIYSAAMNSWFMGWIDSTGRVFIGQYSPSSQAWHVASLYNGGLLEYDDHDDPAVLPLFSGKVLAAYSQHAGYSYCQTTTSVNSISAWGPIVVMNNTAGNGDSYWQLGQTHDTNNTIWAVSRRTTVADGLRWMLRTSTDDGATWTTPFALYKSEEFPYLKQIQTGNRFDFVVSNDHPKHVLTTNNLYHFYQIVKADGSGFAIYDSAGTQIGTYTSAGVKLAGADLPLTPAALGAASIVWDDGNSWMWDILPVNGVLTIAFTTYVDVTDPLDTHSFHRAQLINGVWNTELIHDGATDYVPNWLSPDPDTLCPEYTPGFCLDPNVTDRVYLARKHAVDDARLEQWDKVDGTWAMTADISGTTGVLNARPYAVRGLSPTQIVWWAGSYPYYNSYDTAIYTMRTTPLLPTTKPAIVDFQRSLTPHGAKLIVPLTEGSGTTIGEATRAYQPVMVGELTWADGAIGKELSGWSTSKYITMDDAAVDFNAAAYPKWIYFLYHNTSTAAQAYPVSIGRSTTSTPTIAIGVNVPSAGHAYFIARDDAGNAMTLDATIATLNDGNLHSLMLLLTSASRMDAYFDGKFVGFENAPTIGTTTINQGTIGAHRRDTVAYPCLGSIGFVALGWGAITNPAVLHHDVISGQVACLRKPAIVSPVAAVGDVKSGVDRGDGSLGTYPTTETSQAAQLATDQAAVTAASDHIDGDTTIIGVEGTGMTTDTLRTALGLTGDESVSTLTRQDFQGVKGTIWHVSTAGNDSNDGLSWATAKLTPKTVIEAAAAGDLVLCDGHFTVGSNSINTPDGVSVRGSGRSTTTFTFTRADSDPAAFRSPSNGRLSDFRTVLTGTTGYAFGGIVSRGQSIFTNSTLEKVSHSGGNTVIMLWVNGGSITVRNLDVSGCLSGFASDVLGTTMQISDSQFNVTSSLSQVRGTLYLSNCECTAVSAASADIRGLSGSNGSTIRANNCRIRTKTAAGNSAYDVYNEGTATIVLDGCDYDRTKTYGTYTDVGRVATNASGKATATLDWSADVTNKPTIGTSTLVLQDIPDALKLAPSAGDPATGSLNKHVNDILADTNELQTNQGNWLTATGFATPTNITAGTITTVTNLTNAPTVGDLTDTMKTSVATAVDASTFAGKFAGVTLFVKLIRGLFRKDAMDATAKSEVNLGGGTFNEATDSMEAIRDRGDVAYLTATGFATPTNITAGTITTVTNLTNAPTTGDLTDTMKMSVTTAVDASTLAGKFAGITLVAKWLRGLFRKDVMDSTAKTEINIGGGTFNETTDSNEAMRDRGDAAYLTATGFSTFNPATQEVTPTAASKTGYSLSSSGLDDIADVEPTAKPTNFIGWVRWLIQRHRRASMTSTALIVKSESGETITTQSLSDDGTTQEVGPPV
jgi:hypothetical protein